MKRAVLLVFLLCLAFSSLGCVRRIVTINSQPPGADVYFDRKLIGQTPCEHEFFYYGTHYLELTKEKHSNINTTVKLKGPLYEFFPLSIFSELLIPWEIIDQHSFDFTLQTGEGKEAIISPIIQPQTPLPSPELERVDEIE